MRTRAPSCPPTSIRYPGRFSIRPAIVPGSRLSFVNTPSGPFIKSGHPPRKVYSSRTPLGLGPGIRGIAASTRTVGEGAGTVPASLCVGATTSPILSGKVDGLAEGGVPIVLALGSAAVVSRRGSGKSATQLHPVIITSAVMLILTHV